MRGLALPAFLVCAALAGGCAENAQPTLLVTNLPDAQAGAAATSPRPLVHGWPRAAVIAAGAYARKDSVVVPSAAVTLEFCIEETGAVSGARVVSATPTDRYNDLALATIAKWKFAPVRKNGKPGRRCGVVQTLNLPHLLVRNAPPDTAFASAATGAPPAVTHFKIIPTRRFKPDYPAAAIRKGLSGCVTVALSLERSGAASQLQILTHYPSGIFDVAAVRAVSRWRFSLTDREDSPITLRHPVVIRQTIAFVGSRNTRAQDTLYWICSQTPPRSLIAIPAPEGIGEHTIVTPYEKRADYVTVKTRPGQRLVDGWAKVEFCVNTEGEADEINILKSSPGGLYDRAVSAALSSWEFSARKIGGKAMGTCGLVYEIPIIAVTTLERQPVPILGMSTAVNLKVLGRNVVKKNGTATLAFCVEADGSTSQVKIVRARPRINYGIVARAVIRAEKFWPRRHNGRPVRTCNLEQSVEFRLGRDGLLWRTTH